MKVPQHVNNGGLKKRGSVTFGEESSLDRKKMGAIVIGRGKENVIDGTRSKPAGRNGVDAGSKSGKGPRKGLDDLSFLSNINDGAYLEIPVAVHVQNDLNKTIINLA